MTTAAVAASARRPGLLAGTQQALTLTWRSVLKIRTSPEDVFGLSLTPIVFLLLWQPTLELRWQQPGRLPRGWPAQAEVMWPQDWHH